MAEAMGGDLVLKILQELTSLKDGVRLGAAGPGRNLGKLTQLLGEMAEETRRRLIPDRPPSTLEE